MSTATKPAPFGPDLRAALIAMVRRRVPESEVEDIVQQALAEAIESPHAPKESEALRRWIFGVAKNKVVDYHRRAGRESFELPDVAGTPAPHVEADLLRWAEKNLPDGAENQKTLDWMLREGEGEKLESIAESEKLPPPRVRQRVSRLRRHFKENWQREVALLAALGVIVGAIVLFVMKKDQGPEPITHEAVDSGASAAEPVRRLALEKCANKEWQKCIEGLDEAKKLDPAGDALPAVRDARQAAEDAIKAAPPSPSALPTTAPPSPAPTGFIDDSTSVKEPPVRKTGPTRAKPQSTEPFTPSPPPPSSAFPMPSKSDFPPAKAPPPTGKSQGKPQGKAAPRGGGGSSITSDSDSDVFGAGGGSGPAPKSASKKKTATPLRNDAK